MDIKGKEFADALGSFIAEYRASCHPQISQRGFAEKCGLSRTVINDLEQKKHKGNVLSDTISKISFGLGLKSSFELQKIIEKRIAHPDQITKNNPDENIIISKNSNLYPLFEVAKDLSDKNVEMLHSIALDLKK